MNDAELKLTLFRWIDQLSGERLNWLYGLVEKFLKQPASEVLDYTSDLEAGYPAMAADVVREQEVDEWIEGTLNHEMKP
jgi:hypothetical protein